MQTHGGTDAEKAILAQERQFHARVVVDWYNNGLYNHPLSDVSTYVASASTDRALKGSAPEEILLIEGSSAAQLKVNLGGEYKGMQLPLIFSPYNGLSPLYTQDQIGSEIKYELGIETALGVVWYPQFIGNISTITPDRKRNDVTITALDRVEKLRKPVFLAHWAIIDYWTNRGRTLAQLQDTQNVIQTCLQQCDVSATKFRPAYRPELNVPDNGLDGVGIFVPFNGGIMPTVGWLDNLQAVEFPATESGGPAMYVSQAAQAHPLSPEPTNRPIALRGTEGTTDGDVLKFWPIDRTLTKIDGEHMLGMMLMTDTSKASGSWHITAPNTVLLEYRCGYGRVIKLWVGANQIWGQLVNENNGFQNITPKLTIPSGQQSVEIFLKFDTTTQSGTRAHLRVGNTSTGWQYISNGWPGDTPADLLQGLLTVYHRAGMYDVCYSFRNVYGSSAALETSLWKQAKYAAVLDEGINTLSFNPGVNGKDAWEVITEAVAAEFGSVFWDESGYFRFWNYNTIKGKQDSPVRTISTDQITGLQITNSLDSVRNIYSVQASKKRSTTGVVYSSPGVETFYVRNNSLTRFKVPVKDVLFMEPRGLIRYTKLPPGTDAGNTFPQWNEWVTHGYVMQLLYGDGWREPDFVNVTLGVRAWFDKDGFMVVEINNPWSEAARLAVSNQPTVGNADSQPAMKINGTKIIDYDDIALTTSDRPSINKYGARNYEAKGEWYQEYFNLENLMGTLLPRTVKPIPTTQDITMAGDPRLQLGDTLYLDDNDGFGEQMRVQIYGINREFSVDSGLTDTLTVEMLRPAGVGIWDSSQYGRWDQSFIWS
jgi:hypothetical protein